MVDFFRSMMMTPGSNARLVAKAAAARSDCCTLDLEDGVHPDSKDVARKTVADAMAELPWGPRKRGARINHSSTPDFEHDIRAVAPSRPTYLVLAKVDDADEVERAAAILDSIPGADDVRLWTMIETAKGLQNIDRIAAAPRMQAFIFGAADFAADIRTKRNSLSQVSPLVDQPRQVELTYARGRIVASARAHGLRAIDPGCLDVHDAEATYQAALYAAQFGFDGTSVYSPRQPEHVHRAFRPEPEDLAWASDIVRAFDAAAAEGHTVVVVGGEMVDGPLVRTAQRLLGLDHELQAWDNRFR
ncbi:CoA ester lyase [Jatrophihabitans cynanchi]|uniref:CoA ester lyase n=1 Tax=Jatrophihabitans cynanchi TaxID=2944128 RepID=A0ABY7K434_9ACTN|nr:CoA ester lyase [Jatrophihabitans sp. SB3-54]WAX58387.1 CoA ester lyase [Jatrophihabitans sp. SB3-54]